jgi:hypothetical protein
MIAEMPNQTDREPDFPLFTHTTGGPKPDLPAEQRLRCLPILGVSVEAQVISTIARTTLVQTFTNFSSKAISEADYIFPLYYGSVVISFRCLIGDEKVLVGTVKPKEEAKVEYKRAVERLEVAALLEEHTTEIFESKVGNIPPKATVKVEIVYATELKYDLGGNGVVMTIPTSIAPRYGLPAVDTHGWMDDLAVDGLKINANISCPGPITKLESQTHPISVSFGKPRSKAVSSFSDLTTTSDHEDPTDYLRNAAARLSDPAAKLEKDFVLLIHANGNAYTRSRAIMSRSHAKLDQAAMMISISPQETVQDYTAPGGFHGDIIILADQSSSMNGSKNKLLRETVNRALELLPRTCRLNVMAFGDKCHALWERPCPYNEEEMIQAKDFTSKFQGDMGGTRLLPALEDVIRSLPTPEDGPTQTSTQVIVLTDTEVWEADKTIDRIRQWRRERGGKIRFFALGIGDQVSHHLLEGLATAGGGYADIIPVGAHEDRGEKIQRMIAGACMPPNWTLSITLNGFKRYEPLAVRPNDEDQWYLQSPHQIPPLHPFSRQSILLLFKPGVSELPSHIVAKLSSDTRKSHQMTIPVVEEQSAQSCIHTLAAKAIISDLDSGYQSLPSAEQTNGYMAVKYVDVTPTVKRIGEKLGCTYSVASRWTSFLAVDSGNESEKAANLYRLTANSNLMLAQPLSRPMQPTTILSPGSSALNFTQPNFLQPGPQGLVLNQCASSTYKDRHSAAPATYTSNGVSQSNVGDLPQEAHGIPALPVESTATQEFQSIPKPDIKDSSSPAGPKWNAVHTMRPPQIPLLRTTLRDQDELPIQPKTLLELYNFLMSDRAGMAITLERLGLDLPHAKERPRLRRSLRPGSQIYDGPVVRRVAFTQWLTALADIQLQIRLVDMTTNYIGIDKHSGLVRKVIAALYSILCDLHSCTYRDFFHPFSRCLTEGEQRTILRSETYSERVEKLENFMRRRRGLPVPYSPFLDYPVFSISEFRRTVQREILLREKRKGVDNLIHDGRNLLTRIRFCILIERYLPHPDGEYVLHKLGRLAKDLQDAKMPKEAISLQLLIFGKEVEPPPPTRVCVTVLTSHIAKLQL